MSKASPLHRASFLALGAGLAMIVQPWSHALFAAGFPFTLAALIVHNVAGRLEGRSDGERGRPGTAAADAPAPGSGGGGA